jgi:hypothetical protein
MADGLLCGVAALPAGSAYFVKDFLFFIFTHHKGLLAVYFY